MDRPNNPPSPAQMSMASDPAQAVSHQPGVEALADTAAGKSGGTRESYSLPDRSMGESGSDLHRKGRRNPMKDKSPRQELKDYAESGRLRGILERSGQGLSQDACDLAVRVIQDYCADRRRVPRS